ncbi:DROUGHT SENSITIVE 1 [Striga hermonthica]|uniref:DROUGHT SENSITIVE 1 n=1 Tax=Striga hermonthica TaxID=68872 RepID=A0A9N7MVD5_STRHE|nr:DROUGHT SENSITIVE 1 [Striga hermonthica]
MVGLSAAKVRLVRTAESKSYKRSPLKKPKSETPVVLRRSLRTRGLPPDAATASGLDDDLVDEKQIKDISHLSSNKKSHQRKGPIPWTDAYRGDDGLEYKMRETFSFSWKSVQGEGDGVPCDFKYVEKLNVTKKMRGAVDVTALELRPENVARLVPGRIMNVRFFPTLDRQMVVVGNKFGDIGFWNVNGERTGDDGIYLFHPHSGPVSGITIDPFSISKMYSSCYDGFIRMMDVEKEVFDLIHFSESSIFFTCLNPHDVKSLYFSEGGAVPTTNNVANDDVRAGNLMEWISMYSSQSQAASIIHEQQHSSTVHTSAVHETPRLYITGLAQFTSRPYARTSIDICTPIHSSFTLVPRSSRLYYAFPWPSKQYQRTYQQIRIPKSITPPSFLGHPPSSGEPPSSEPSGEPAFSLGPCLPPADSMNPSQIRAASIVHDHQRPSTVRTSVVSATPRSFIAGPTQFTTRPYACMSICICTLVQNSFTLVPCLSRPYDAFPWPNEQYRRTQQYICDFINVSSVLGLDETDHGGETETSISTSLLLSPRASPSHYKALGQTQM